MLARRRQRIPHVSSGTFHVMTNDQIKIDGDNGHWQFLKRQSMSDTSPAAALNAPAARSTRDGCRLRAEVHNEPAPLCTQLRDAFGRGAGLPNIELAQRAAGRQ
jgi:hypothetical protein